jgi:peptidoglycan/LPS O-acetylase OafA/YrhL
VPRTTAPGTLRWAVRLLLVQAVGAAVVGGVLVYAAFTQTALSLASAITTVAVPFGLAVLLAALSWQLNRRRSWARGLAIVLELLLLLLGYTMITGGAAWAGVPLMALSLGGAVLLLAPSSREALGIH